MLGLELRTSQRRGEPRQNQRVRRTRGGLGSAALSRPSEQKEGTGDMCSIPSNTTDTFVSVSTHLHPCCLVGADHVGSIGKDGSPGQSWVFFVLTALPELSGG